MAKKKLEDAGAGELLSGIVEDVERLIGQHLDLFRQEVKEEIGKATSAAVSGASGTLLVALGGLLGTHAAVHLLSRATRMPLWASYGAVAGILGGAGLAQLARARSQAGDLSLGLPQQTTAALQEDLAWIRAKAPLP